MISNYFKYWLKKLQFIIIVISRFFKILFRKNRNINLLLLDYNTDYIFKNSLIIINYRFRNGIWYKFGNHKTTEKQIKIFNLKNFDQEFELTVFGWFQKKKYLLKFEPTVILNNHTFKTSLNNLFINLEDQNIPKFDHPNINLSIKSFDIDHTKINFITKPITINNNPFKLNEFI